MCDELGGFLPHDYSGYSGVGGFGDQWHWVGYGANDNNCWACRPSRWREGVRAFPCNTPLPFGCQRRRAYPLPFPRRRPKIYRERLAFPVDDLLDARPGPRFRNTLESPFVPRRNLNSVLRNNPYLYIWIFFIQISLWGVTSSEPSLSCHQIHTFDLIPRNPISNKMLLILQDHEQEDTFDYLHVLLQ